MSCQVDSDCPFLFHCQDDLKCYHDNIFPLKLYTCIIYLFFPIAVGMANMTGNSMGIWKVLLVMNLLRYDISDSTAIVQPMVAGAAFPNFFNIIMKKHPHRAASLVDFNIVYILIPCCVLGSTLGSFIQEFIPELVQDILVVMFFSFFTFRFIKKLKDFKKQQAIDNENKESLVTEENNLNQNNQEEDSLDSEEKQEKSKILEYENSLHLWDVGMSFVVFIVFQFFVFLVQGKFSFYQISICSFNYFGGLIFLVLLTLGYLYLINNKMKDQFDTYREFKIPYNLDLSQQRVFIMIGLGGFAAGIVQGILGVCSGTFIMGVFLAFNLDPRVASATSGYQVFFIGSASFIEGFITNSISLEDALFLFGVCSILGGLVTMGFYAYLKNRDNKSVNKLLVTVITVLCMISAIGVFPSAIQTWIQFGWDYLIKIKFHC